ncbi:MAG: DUF4417 domain-containing protein [Lachnospiraceae bacterium]|nr:DUF4417 domain-containing protein [Lachnospiraceae bacterium]
MNSFIIRNDPLFLRNEFDVEGKWGFPVIKKQELSLENLDLISCSDVSKKDTKNLYKGVHFFVDDFRFESLYKNPEKALERYGKYKFLLTPDYSLYAEMNPWRQIESVGKARWVGAKWQSCGKIVIPTVSWALTRSYEFCFDGIERNCIVAIGMIGCKREKVNFLRGYDQMLNRIEPEAIICFGQPFDEMEGNIIVVDYLKSRKVVR